MPCRLALIVLFIFNLKPLTVKTSQEFHRNDIYAFDDSAPEGFEKGVYFERDSNVFVKKKGEDVENEDYVDRGKGASWDVKVGSRGSGKQFAEDDSVRDINNRLKGSIDYDELKELEGRPKKSVDPQYPDECSREPKFDLGWIKGQPAKPIKKQNLIRESVMGKRDIEYIRIDNIHTHEPSSKSKLDKFIKRSAEILRSSVYDVNHPGLRKHHEKPVVAPEEANEKWLRFAQRVKALRSKLRDEETQRKMRRRVIRNLQGRTATVINGEIHRIVYPIPI